MKASVIIVTQNGTNLLQLASLGEVEEILIVDDASIERANRRIGWK